MSFFWLGFSDTKVTYGSLDDLKRNFVSYVYPNPASNSLNISIDGYQDVSITFYDVIGKKIYDTEIENRETTIDVSNWQRGIYFYSLEQNGLKQQGGKVILE